MHAACAGGRPYSAANRGLQWLDAQSGSPAAGRAQHAATLTHHPVGAGAVGALHPHAAALPARHAAWRPGRGAVLVSAALCAALLGVPGLMGLLGATGACAAGHFAIEAAAAGVSRLRLLLSASPAGACAEQRRHRGALRGGAGAARMGAAHWGEAAQPCRRGASAERLHRHPHRRAPSWQAAARLLVPACQKRPHQSSALPCPADVGALLVPGPAVRPRRCLRLADGPARRPARCACRHLQCVRNMRGAELGGVWQVAGALPRRDAEHAGRRPTADVPTAANCSCDWVASERGDACCMRAPAGDVALAELQFPVSRLAQRGQLCSRCGSSRMRTASSHQLRLSALIVECTPW